MHSATSATSFFILEALSWRGFVRSSYLTVVNVTLPSLISGIGRFYLVFFFALTLSRPTDFERPSSTLEDIDILSSLIYMVEEARGRYESATSIIELVDDLNSSVFKYYDS